MFPVLVDIEFEDGSRIVEKWDGDDRWIRYAYERTANLWVPIAMHLIFNTLQTGLFLLSRQL